jgi:hypothetical protein
VLVAIPVILATRESEIRKITVRSQLGKIVLETLSRKNLSQNIAGGVAQGIDTEFKFQYHTHKECHKKTEHWRLIPVILHIWEVKRLGGSQFEISWVQETPSPK